MRRGGQSQTTGAAERPAPGRAQFLAKALAALVAICVLAALAGLAKYERRETLENAQARAELISRTLEEHVTRTIGSASVVIQTLGEAVARQPPGDPARLQSLLSQTLLASLPYLRGAAVLDEQGAVLASSVPEERGLRIDLARLGRVPGDHRDVLLPLQHGRSLADLAVGVVARAAPGVDMLPLLRTLRGPGGERLLLVALINPGVLANFQQVALSGEDGVAALAGFDGQLIVANDRLAVRPGRRIEGHPIFDSWLPAREHGQYIGAGLREGAQVVAFRASRTRPLVVTVELAVGTALRTWYERAWWLAAAGGLVLLAIASGAKTLLRAMNARERARSALDGAHEQVALRERELSVLLRSVQEVIFRTDAAGAITFVNARWAAISDQPLEQARGRCFCDLVIDADRARTAALFSVDDLSGVREAQVCIPAADARVRHFVLAVVPLFKGGQIVGFAGSAVNVSERVAAEQQLQHQLAFTELLLQMSPLPVSMFDAQGRYVMVNHAWEEFVGRTRAQVVGSPVGHFLPAEAAALHADQDAELMARGGRLRYETRVQHRDGSLRDMVVTKVLVPGEDGRPAGILCTLMDVSEFRDAERATREARDAAEEASRAKSEFVANISHELRTPLQAILGFSELGYTRGLDNPRLAGMFNDIHNSGQRMLALVNDLLDVSKIESAVGTFDLERCDLRTLVNAVLRELAPLVGKRRLRLSVALPEQPLRVKVDPLRMQQAIRNVVANAIKFSPEGGQLEVQAAEAADGEVWLTVADRGPGIPPAEIETIFDAFVQSSKTKDGSGGTGLGLAICRKIIDIHGGRISAENRPGGGAVFRIQLPQRPSGDSQLDSSF
jgi:PAS domain S-box-containing protein